MTLDFSKSTDPSRFGWSPPATNPSGPDGIDNFDIFGHRIATIILPNGRRIDIEVALISLYAKHHRVDRVDAYQPAVVLTTAWRDAKELINEWQLPPRMDAPGSQTLDEWYDKRKNLRSLDAAARADWSGTGRDWSDGITIGLTIRNSLDPKWTVLWIGDWQNMKNPPATSGSWH